MRTPKDHVHLSVPLGQAPSWEEAATKEGLSLSAWVTRELNKAIGKETDVSGYTPTYPHTGQGWAGTPPEPAGLPTHTYTPTHIELEPPDIRID